MDNQNLDEEVVLNTSDESTDSVNEPVEGENEVEQEEDVSSLKEELNKLKSAYENQKKRAEKAEAEAKKRAETKTYTKPSSSNDLSAMDIIAVTKAGIDEDVLGEVIEFAKFKKISVAEAIKSPLMKATIAQRTEEKKSAEVAHTGASRKGGTRVSDDLLFNNAKAGVLPDESDIDRLVRYRLKNR